MPRVVVALALVIAFAAPARADVPCAEDVAKLCKDVPVGGGRIQDCLKQNEAKVSASCRERIDGLADEIKLAAAVCRGTSAACAPASSRVMASSLRV